MQEEELDQIGSIARKIAQAKTKGELGSILAAELAGFRNTDLQVIGGRLYAELCRLPSPYREQVSPYIKDQLLGAYHRLLLDHRRAVFSAMNEPISDREMFLAFCEMMPEGCRRWDESTQRLPFRFTPYHRCFYYIISAFTIFVLEEPGHPVGMPFPGGFKVEEENGVFQCPIRDREKDVPFSICNFCPAIQDEGINRL
ncbi:DUF2115 domain-containing protein [Methanolacinia paynteri]|uniref:DUF2115 domain-containing protein n=1 Tax=Methanolacinia paynteri TaxID=230356 RepID=UPI00064E4650|nr:DUF2115 domain-containing protein [Methanolacinia paynteri]